MPPPMPNPSKRMTAQPSRPVARYRPGKAVAEEESSEEEESDQEQRQKPQRKHAQRPQPSRPRSQTQQEEDTDDDEEGFVTDPEEEDGGGVQIPGAKSTVPTARPATDARISNQPILKSEDEESEAESDEESESESEAEDSSSEDEPKRKVQRPTFMKKTEREPSTIANGTTLAPEASETPGLEEEDRVRRLAQTEDLIADRIKRDALARAAGRKGWDDDEDFAPEELVDDTDGLDPEAEHQAWRLRELQRLKRDREAMISREKKIEELDRRRKMTVEEREKEDKEFLSKQKEEHDEGKGQSGYLARYHHKGAFFQDDEAAEILKRRDVMGARFVDEVSDKSALPEYMRVRDMTKLGKKGRTRYKDLRNEDTGRWGDEVRRWRGAGDNRGGDGESMDVRGVDERFLPDRDRGGPSVSGANASAVGERRQRYRSRSRSRSPRRREAGGDTYRPHRRSYSRSRSRSRSKSRRKRSPSPGRSRGEDNAEKIKRRRLVDAV